MGGTMTQLCRDGHEMVVEKTALITIPQAGSGETANLRGILTSFTAAAC